MTIDHLPNTRSLKEPLGWKAKIGLILPAQEEGQTSYEYRSMCPEGVITLETRVMGNAIHCNLCSSAHFSTSMGVSRIVAPAFRRTSCFPATVPAEPRTMAPACPIRFPSGE